MVGQSINRRVNTGSVLVALSLGAILFALPESAMANTDKIRERCDRDGNGFIERGEIEAYKRLAVSPTLQALDKDCSGAIEPSELSEIEKAVAVEVDESFIERDEIDGDFRRANGRLPIVTAGGGAEKDEKDFPRLFVSGDRLDVRAVALSGDANAVSAAAGGAVLRFTNDRKSDQTTAAFDGVVSFFLCGTKGDSCPGEKTFSAAAASVFLDVDGQIKSTGTKPSRMTLGADVDLELFRGPFDLAYLSFGPYVQTDFEGRALAYGAKASFTPFKLDWQLGHGLKDRGGDIRDYFFWQADLNGDVLFVDEPGETGLKDHNYAWFGGNAKVRIFPLKGYGDDAERIFMDVEGSYHWDVVSSESASKIEASVGWQMLPNERLSLELAYEAGKDYRTLTDVEQYTLQVEFKY